MAMTKEEIKERMEELKKVFRSRSGKYTEEEKDEAHTEYEELQDALDTMDITTFYERNIKGKTWEEVDPNAWEVYSDWHKDIYGYRPRMIF